MAKKPRSTMLSALQARRRVLTKALETAESHQHRENLRERIRLIDVLIEKEKKAGVQAKGA